MLIACIPATEFKSTDKWRLFIIDHVFTLKYFLCVIASQTGRFDKEKGKKYRRKQTEACFYKNLNGIAQRSEWFQILSDL